MGGDSITQGDLWHASYRYQLFKRLCQDTDGLNFAFTGFHTANYGRDSCVNDLSEKPDACMAPEPSYVSDAYPCDWEAFQKYRFHEGHAGWRSDHHFGNPEGTYPTYKASGTGN